FAGEVTVFFGAWKAFSNQTIIVVIACWAALIVGAIYMLRAIRNILHGPLAPEWANLSDANFWRKIPFVVLLASLIIFGCFPSLLTDKIRTSVQNVVSMATTAEPRASTEPNIASATPQP